MICSLPSEPIWIFTLSQPQRIKLAPRILPYIGIHVGAYAHTRRMPTHRGRTNPACLLGCSRSIPDDWVRIWAGDPDAVFGRVERFAGRPVDLGSGALRQAQQQRQQHEDGCLDWSVDASHWLLG